MSTALIACIDQTTRAQIAAGPPHRAPAAGDVERVVVVDSGGQVVLHDAGRGGAGVRPTQTGAPAGLPA